MIKIDIVTWIIALWFVILKNIQRIIHSRFSFVIILLGPIVLMLTVGIAFNTSDIGGISVGVYSGTYTEYAKNIIDNIQLNSKRFLIMSKDSEDLCRQGVKDGDIHICLIFPVISSDEKPEVRLYVDYSRINLVFALLEVMNSELARESASIGAGLMEQLLSNMNTVQDSLISHTNAISDLHSALGSFESHLFIMSDILENVSVEVPNKHMFSDVAMLTNSTKKDIFLIRDTVKRDIIAYREQLEDAKVQLDEKLKDVREEKNNRQELKDGIDESYVSLSCNRKNPVDLMPYLDEPDMLEDKLAEVESPECSLLYTMSNYLEDSLSVLRDAEEDIIDMQMQIEDSQKSLDELEVQTDFFYMLSNKQLNLTQEAFLDADEMIDDAHMQAVMLEERKMQMRDRLNNLSGNTEIVSTTVGNIETFLHFVSEEIENATSVNADDIVSPFKVSINPVTEKQSNLDYLYSPLFILLIMFVAVLLGVTLMNKEKSSRAHFRNFITPIPDIVFIMGMMATSVFLTFIQVLVMILLGVVVFGMHIGGSVFGILLIVFIGIVLFSLIGIVIGGLFSSEETTTLLGIIFCVILFLFSSSIIPIEKMSVFSRYIVQFNPFYLLEFLFRKQLIFGTFISAYPIQVFILLCEIVVFSFAVVWAWYMIRRRF